LCPSMRKELPKLDYLALTLSQQCAPRLLDGGSS
jgi:hypothetical protein